MGIDVTTLAIAVTSSGISEAAKALDGLVASANNAERAFPGLRTAAEALNASNKSSVDQVEKLLEKLTRQADLLGANKAAINAYDAASKGATQTEIARAKALGAEVDAFKALGQAQIQATKMNKDFDASNQKIIQNSASEILRKQAASYKELASAQSEAIRMNKQWDAGIALNQQGLRDHEQAVKKASGAHHEFNLVTAGSTRELLVLIHEMSQGQFQRFGGSMIVMAERINFLPRAMEAATKSAAGFGLSLGVFLTILATAAIAITAFFVAVYTGASEQKKFNDALIQTGNYAGTTAAALEDMAHWAASSGGSLGDAKKATLELAASGKFTASQIQLIAEAATLTEKAFGVSVDKTVKQFEVLATEAVTSGKASTDVISKHAISLNEHYHFLTVAQFEAISNLEKTGHAAEAAAIAEAALAKVQIARAQESIANLGYLARAWNGVKEAIGGAWSMLESFGKKDTLADEIKQSKKNLDAIYTDNNLSVKARMILHSEMSQHLVDLYAKQQAGIKAAEKAGIDARKVQDTIEAERSARTTREQFDHRSAAIRALAKFDTDVQNSSAAEQLANAEGNARARLELVKKTKEKEAKGGGVGLSGVDAAVKEIEAVNEVQRRGFDNEIKLIDLKQKYHQISDTDAATQRDKILQREYLAFTDNYKKEIAIVETFHDKSGRLMNDAAIKRSAIEEKLGKLQDTNMLRQEENFARELFNSTASERAEQKRFDAFSKTTEKEIEALQAKIAAYAALPEAIKAAGVTQKQMQDYITQAQIDSLEVQLLEDTLGQAQIDRLNSEIRLLKEKKALQTKVEGLDNGNTDALGTPARLKAEAAAQAQIWKSTGNEIEKALTTAFGNAGKAAGTMFKAYAEGQAKQIQISQQLREATDRETKQKGSGIETINKLQAESSAVQLATYGNMADAAQGFFDANSTGYKVLGGISKAFHIAELAMTIASIAPNIAAGAAKMFSQLGIWGFAAVAGMVAVMAGFGFGGGGGSAPPTSAERQASQGAGSVLGDDKAKSDSIAKSLAIMEKNSGLGLAQGNDMVKYLRVVADSITGLSSLIVRTTGITGDMAVNTKGGAENFFKDANANIAARIFAGPLGSITNKVVGGILGSIFGGATTTLDTGFTLGKSTVGGVARGGISGSQYTDTKTDGGWFHSDSFNTAMSSLGKDADDQFTKIINNMAASINEAGKLLGIGGDDFTAHLQTFVIDIGKVSLKGLTGDAITKVLESVFSKLGDDMAKFGVAGLDKFQQVGEGYFETLTRVANDLMQVKDVFAVLGKSMTATGIEAVTVSENLIQAAGGLDKLTSGTKYFIDNFLTEAEKMGPIVASVQTRLAELGQSGITTIDQYKSLVMAQDLNTTAGQDMYAALLQLAPAFKAAADFTNKLAEVTDIQNKQHELDLRLMEATGKVAEATAIRRQDEIDALNKLSPALGATHKAINDATDASKAAADAMEDWTNFSSKKNQLYMSLLQAQGKAEEATTLQRKAELEALEKTYPMLVLYQQAIYDAADAMAINTKRHSLDIELLTAQGNAAGALAMQRKDELDALAKLSPSLATLKQTIYDTADAAALAAKRATLEISLMEATGNATGALAAKRKIELATIDKALQGTQIALYQALDAAAARTSAMAVLNKSITAAKAEAQGVYDAQMASIKAQRDAAAQVFNATKTSVEATIKSADNANSVIIALANSLQSTLDGMSLATEVAMDRMTAQMQLSDALSTAKSTGVLPTAESIAHALSVVSNQTPDLFSSNFEFTKDFQLTKNKISDLNDLAGSQKSIVQQQLDVLQTSLDTAQKAYDQQLAGFDAAELAAKAQLDATNADLDSKLKTAQAQLDAINGTTVAVLSVKDALAAFAAALSSTPAPFVPSTISTPTASTTGSTSAASGLDAYMKLVRATPTYSAAIEPLIIADYLEGVKSLGTDGSHAGGLDYVPKDNYKANLHVGERVQTARAARDADKTAEEIRQLRDEIQAQNLAIIQSTKAQEKIFRKWDGEGIPAERTV